MGRRNYLTENWFWISSQAGAGTLSTQGSFHHQSGIQGSGPTKFPSASRLKPMCLQAGLGSPSWDSAIPLQVEHTWPGPNDFVTSCGGFLLWRPWWGYRGSLPGGRPACPASSWVCLGSVSPWVVGGMGCAPQLCTLISGQIPGPLLGGPGPTANDGCFGLWGP